MTKTEHPPFAVAVDLVVLSVVDGALSALAIDRGEPPFMRWPALPGGFVRPEEDLAQAASRELAEETGVDIRHLEQLGAYGDPERDPRMRVVSIAYLAFAPETPSPLAGTDAASVAWRSVDELLSADLAFDHARILGDGVERTRAKLEYTTLATAFVPAEFTIGELRGVYETIWGLELDPRNFHRKVLASDGFVVETPRMTARGGGRPARLYRAGTTATLFPPIQRGP